MDPARISLVRWLAFVGFASPMNAGQQDPPAHARTLPPETIHRLEHAFHPVAGLRDTFAAPNRGQGFRSQVSPAGIEIVPRTSTADGESAPWTLRLRTCGLSRGGRELALRAPSISVRGERADLDHGPLDEWFVNRASGIEQGWTVVERPSGEGALTIELELSGGFEARIVGERDACLVGGEVALPYSNLRAWSANGQGLAARFVPREHGLAIEIDDGGAVYPVTVDPTLAWMVEGNQADGEFGASVATAGDVNGDGYGDVIVGAYLFDNGQTDEGRAYVYLGSASGLATSPAWTAESDQASADFGWSVATAGDVNDDGYGDVIVGARFFNNGEMDEGRAYVYLGSATGLATSPAWTAESDQEDAWFGHSVATAGDVNGDDYDDVIVGANSFANPQTDEGRAYVYLGSATGLATSPAWTAEGDQDGAIFGESVATAGDVDGDGYDDVIVGAYGFDNGQTNEGRAYVYQGSATGLATSPAWTAESDQEDAGFGVSVATAGDVNGDGYGDVSVSAYLFDNGEMNEGRAYVYLGSATGLATSPAWTAESDQAGAEFGYPIATAGDVNGDGYGDVIVSDYWFDNGQTNEGAAFLYLGVPSLVLYEDKISQTAGGFGGTLADGDRFGYAVAAIGDLDGDLVQDLAVGAPDNEGGGTDRGGVWILFLSADRTVASELLIDDVSGSFGGALDDVDDFGAALAAPGDLDGDNIPDLLVGAPGDDDGGTDRGAVWILYLNADGTVKSEAKISSSSGGFGGALDDGDAFGTSIATLGNLNGAGGGDLAVGAPRDDDGGTDRGAVWILFLDASEAVTAQAKISQTSGGFPDSLGDGDEFGEALASLGDLDAVGSGVVTLAVGAPGDDTFGADAGTLWSLDLTTAGTVSSLSPGDPPGAPRLGVAAGDRLGAALVNLGSLDGIGALNVAIGAPGDDGAGANAGALWIASLDATGRFLGAEKLTEGVHNFAGGLDAGDLFATGLASLGDSDGDGRTDLIVGAHQDDDGGTDRGAVWIFSLNDGTLSLTASATTWTGATDTQWELASNWGNGVPDSTKTAIIPDATTTPNDPSITAGGQQCNSLWIQAGGTLNDSAGMDGLGVFGGATVSGPITGTGELVFEAAGTLAGDQTIGLTFDPAVRADADLELQGGPLSITGSFQGNTDVHVAGGATIDVGGSMQVAGDLAIDGDFSIGDGVTVIGTLSSTSSGGLEVMGSGACVVAGQLCFRGDVTTSCSLSVERSVPDTTAFEATNGWPAGVAFDVVGTVELLTADLSIGGDFLLQNGTLVLGVDSKITTGGASGIRIADADTLDPIAFFDVGERLLQVPAAEGITVGDRGKLNLGAGGELELAGTLTVESGGTLCMDGVPSDRASISSYLGNRYTLTLDSGSTLAAKGFAFTGMTSPGIVIGSGVTLAAAPYDLRAGVFDDAPNGGILLDIQRALATQLRYLRFDNSFSASGVSNVRTTLASMPITLVNWSGDLAPDATTAETFDIDPGESSPPERIVFAPPEASDVQAFAASWVPGYARTTWQTLAEVDSESFLVQRSPEPPGLFTEVGETPSVGASSYELQDYGASVFAAWRYRLYELLTHGELRLIDEVMLPASGIVLRTEGSTPAPPAQPPQPLVVGPGGRYPDVRTALRELARSGRRTPVTLELARGTHAPFELGRGLAFDLCLVGRPGAVIDAARAPLRITELSPKRSLELVDLVVDSRRSAHSSVEVENSLGVVLLQDVTLRSNANEPALRLTKSNAVALQGGRLEGALALESRSRATASGTRLTALEITGRSILEIRGTTAPAVVEPGSILRAHAAAPQLTLDGGRATLEAGGPGLAWLGLAPGLGFGPSRRPLLLEGVLMLEPTSYAGFRGLRPLVEGRTSWQLGPLPPGEPCYFQGFAFEPSSGRICLSDVVRLER